MKKIITIALACLVSFSSFAESKSKNYLVKTELYSINNGNDKLLSSLSEAVSNNGERKLSFVSREDNNKPFDLEDGVLITARISEFGKYDLMDFVGNSTIKNEKGSIEPNLSFKTKLFLKDEQAKYEETFPFNVKDKEYLVKMTATRVNDIEPKESNGFLRISNIVVKDSECSSDGLVAKTKKGIEVSCHDGKWE